MDLHINGISFLSTVFALVFVVIISIYGAAQCFRFGKMLAGFGMFAIIPVWFATQLAIIVAFDRLRVSGVAARQNHLEYEATPIFNVAVAVFVWVMVMRYVRKLAAAQASVEVDEAPVSVEGSVLSRMLVPKKVGGVLLILLGAGVSPVSVISSVLFIMIGVSLIMDVNLWRK